MSEYLGLPWNVHRALDNRNQQEALIKLTERYCGYVALPRNAKMKPHLWKPRGSRYWICYHEGDCDQGYGASPLEAYQNWAKGEGSIL